MLGDGLDDLRSEPIWNRIFFLLLWGGFSKFQRGLGKFAACFFRGGGLSVHTISTEPFEVCFSRGCLDSTFWRRIIFQGKGLLMSRIWGRNQFIIRLLYGACILKAVVKYR